jgi:adenylate cyclase class IV
MYETEIKVEIPSSDLQQLLSICRERGFIDKGVAPQRDYYVKAVLSQYGDPKAFDIERYRSESSVFFYTKKEWEVENGEPVRTEDEREVTQSEFEGAVAEHPNALKIVKDRQSFDASFEGRAISLSIDSVKFDHSPALRYFMEPEILVEDKAMVPETKHLLRRFIADLLGISVSEIVEAPGMFAMAFKKL